MIPQKQHRYVYAAVLTAVLSAFFVYFPVTNTDIWWHLASARQMIAQKSILRTDPFSFTPSETPWVNIHWLFQLPALAVYRVSGTAGLIFVKCVIFAGSVLLLFFAVPKGKHAVIYSLIFCLFVFPVRYMVLARPVVVTLFFMALFIFLLERYHNTRKLRFLAYLVPVQMLWTNMQALFILGPVIFGAYLIEEKFHKKVLFCYLLVLLSCFAGPYGLKGALLPFKLFGLISDTTASLYSMNVSENLPLPALAGDRPFYVYAFIICAVTVAAVVLMNFRFLRVSHTLLFIGFLYLAFVAERNMLLYFLFSAFYVSHNISIHGSRILSGLPVRPVPHAVKKALFYGACALAVLFTGLHGYAVSKYPSKTGLSPFRVPEGAAAFLKENPVQGNIFNSVRFGGYLLWEMFPEKKVFIDGRITIRRPEFFKDYLAVLDNPGGFYAVRDRYNISHVLLPVSVFKRYHGLSRTLFRDQDWAVAFLDETAVLFVKRNSLKSPEIRLEESSDLRKIVSNISDKWQNDPFIRKEALAYLSRFLEDMGCGAAFNLAIK